ncbi:UNVERIFIED_CONTAM: hypothetical protein NCL1_25534 [Trichonephila clavipes]
MDGRIRRRIVNRLEVGKSQEQEETKINVPKAINRWRVQTRIPEYHVIELKRVCGRLRDAPSCRNGSKDLQNSASEIFDMIRYD